MRFEQYVEPSMMQIQLLSVGLTTSEMVCLDLKTFSAIEFTLDNDL